MKRREQQDLKGLLLGSVALLALGVLAPSVHGAPENLVQVCHRDPNNPASFRIITVPSAAVDVHLTYGDTVVQPEVCDGVDNDCDGIVDNNVCGDFGTCTVGTGQCEKTGPMVCMAGLIVCSVSSSACEGCLQQCQSTALSCGAACQSQFLQCQAGCIGSPDPFGCAIGCQNAALNCPLACHDASTQCEAGCL